MVEFWLWTLAAALWIIFLTGVYTLFRQSPEHPFQSIRRFRAARRTLAPPKADPPAETPPGAAADIVPEVPSNLPELEVVIEPVPALIVLDEEKETAASGPRRANGLTYLVVDDDGRPLAG